MSTPLRLVTLGPPGAGKGTLARKLAERHGVAHVSSGDIFRAEVAAGTPLGREVARYIVSGRLVPDGLTVRVLRVRLDAPDMERGFILDGFPRTRPQAEALQDLLEEAGQALDAALLLSVPDAVLVDRLTARRVCPVCGAIYNLRFDPPRHDARCDRVERHGEVAVVQREDDTEETVRRRLAVYHQTTGPLVGYYRERGLLAAVDAADASPDDVFRRTQAVLAEKGVVPAS